MPALRPVRTKCHAVVAFGGGGGAAGDSRGAGRTPAPLPSADVPGLRVARSPVCLPCLNKASGPRLPGRLHA